MQTGRKPVAANRIAKGKGHGTLRDKLAKVIRDAIMDGIYLPGAPLAEEELARRFNVSRGPVREAMIELSKEYLIRSYPNRGSFVNRLTEEEFDEMLRLRSILEPLAMESARSKASPERIEALKRILRTLEEHGRSGDLRRFADTDFQFHRAVWDLSERPLLKQVLELVSRPMFVFFQIQPSAIHMYGWPRHRTGRIELFSIARSHQLMIDYIEGKTDLNARACFRPVIEETPLDEKPSLATSG